MGGAKHGGYQRRFYTSRLYEVLENVLSLRQVGTPAPEATTPHTPLRYSRATAPEGWWGQMPGHIQSTEVSEL